MPQKPAFLSKVAMGVVMLALGALVTILVMWLLADSQMSDCIVRAAINLAPGDAVANVEMQNASAVVSQDEKYEQDSESDSRNHEEIDGYHCPDMIFKKGADQRNQDIAHGSRT